MFACGLVFLVGWRAGLVWTVDRSGEKQKRRYMYTGTRRHKRHKLDPERSGPHYVRLRVFMLGKV